MIKNITKNSIFITFILIFSIILAGSVKAAEINDASPSKANAPVLKGGGGGNGNQIILAPVITSTQAMNVTGTTATLEGSVNPNGSATTAYFEVFTFGNFQSQKIGAGTLDVTLNSYTMSGLTPNTKYKFRIVAVGSATTYGNWVAFITSNGTNPQLTSKPTIVSTQATNITKTSATMNGSVNPNGLATTAWFELSTGATFKTQNIGNGNIATTLNQLNVTNLTAGTNYQLRIVASNSMGTTTGNWTSFTTIANSNGGSHGGGGGYIFSATTLGSNNITENSAVLLGSSTLNTSIFNGTVWFEYSTSSNLATVMQTTHTSLNSANFSKNIVGLTPNTIYYFRAVASSTLGTKTGSIMSFKTLPHTIVVVNPDPQPNPNPSPIVEEKTTTDTEPVNILNENKNELSAASLFGYETFIPTTVLGWIILIIIFIIIILITREILKTFKRKSKEIPADHIDNLPM